MSTAVKLGEQDTLKITFQIVDKETGNGVQPHQTFLRFYDEKSNEEGIQPVRVTPGGKAKFELVLAFFPSCQRLVNLYSSQNLQKAPLSLPPTPNSDPLKLTLIVGTDKYDPISLDFFDLILPKTQPAPEHPLEASFHSLPEIKHTFRPDHQTPPRPISAVFAVVVLAPWVVLLSLVRAVVVYCHNLTPDLVAVVQSSTETLTSFLPLHLSFHCYSRRI